MACNDAALIDGILDERVEQGIPSRDHGGAFAAHALAPRAATAFGGMFGGAFGTPLATVTGAEKANQ